jgi:2-keto-4-pentenoate hydratase/2-oxohepta-3-ene-1,7-dioic acid hydratase in catechol pathway
MYASAVRLRRDEGHGATPKWATFRGMRIARIALPKGDVVFARLHGDLAEPLSAAPWLDGVPASGERAKIAWTPASLRVPVTPSKILCIGRNYAAHAKELGHDVPKEPMLFLKPPSSLLDPGGTIRLPPESERVEHEAELGVVIGRTCRDVRREDALEHVFGYTCVGDITARDLQRKDVQFTRAKGFDTFCPVGPWIETELDPGRLAVRCRVNGAARQDGLTSDMIFDVPSLVAYASRMMTLEPGDIIATGTPEGVGPLVNGDRLEIEIDGIGLLVNDVASRARSAP